MNLSGTVGLVHPRIEKDTVRIDECAGESPPGAGRSVLQGLSKSEVKSES